MAKSVAVGVKYAQLEGKKSRDNDDITITNLSNHIPTFTNTAIINIGTNERRSFLNQNSCGEITLQEIIIQYAQAYGPNALLIKVNCSA